ncbi:MAG: iron-sulfur cluster assembly accessory protein [Idiomarina sp.]|nr:iron-sulfur cluster assembly accessory protein [Idiomarina sp.]
MSVEAYVPSKDIVTLTESAVRHFTNKLANEPGKIVRVSTKVNGCTGYAYVLDMAEAPATDDAVVQVNDNLIVAIASDSVNLLRNTEIDYVREGINGVVKFNNPNVADMCGCGESFSVNN